MSEPLRRAPGFAGDLQPRQARQRHVHEEDVGRELSQQAKRVDAIGRFPENAKLGPHAGELGAKLVAQDVFVLDD